MVLDVCKIETLFTLQCFRGFVFVIAIVTDGGMMSMKSMPPMHNGVFQGDNFPPPAAK